MKKVNLNKLKGKRSDDNRIVPALFTGIVM